MIERLWCLNCNLDITDREYGFVCLVARHKVELRMNQPPCNHCSGHEHKLFCNCGHIHNQHVFGGGCTAVIATGKMCNCKSYSQTRKNKHYGLDVRGVELELKNVR